MKYLLALLPTLAFANFVSEKGGVTYWEQAVCEKTEAAPCYAKPLDSETKTLKEVEVDGKIEKIFVEDAEKVAAKAAEKAKLGQKETSCEQFKLLLDDSAIDSKSKPEDVQEVVRRLLGFYKACR